MIGWVEEWEIARKAAKCCTEREDLCSSSCPYYDLDESCEKQMAAAINHMQKSWAIAKKTSDYMKVHETVKEKYDETFIRKEHIKKIENNICENPLKTQAKITMDDGEVILTRETLYELMDQMRF